MIIASLSKCSQHISQAIILSLDAQIRQNYKVAIKLMAIYISKSEINSDLNNFGLQRFQTETNLIGKELDVREMTM